MKLQRKILWTIYDFLKNIENVKNSILFAKSKIIKKLFDPIRYNVILQFES